MVQVFQDPGFSGYRFFWVQVFQGLSPDFRSSPKVDCHFKLFTFTSWYLWLQFSFKHQHKKYMHQYANLCFQRSFSKAEDTLWNISFRLFHETQFNAYFITHNWISWNSCKICKKESYLNYDAFFVDYFTRDEKRRNSFSNELSSSSTVNEFRTGTLCRILNYLIEHLNVLDNYRLLFVEDRKERCHFLRKQAKTSKEYHVISVRNVNLYQNTKFYCSFCQGA